MENSHASPYKNCRVCIFFPIFSDWYRSDFYTRYKPEHNCFGIYDGLGWSWFVSKKHWQSMMGVKMDLKSRAVIAKPENLNRIVEYGRQCHANQATGQVDLFAGEGVLPPLELEDADPWTLIEALEGERVSIGFYLSGHPLDGFFEQMRLALWYKELKRRNNIKYGSHLLNRPEGAKRHVRKFR